MARKSEYAGYDDSHDDIIAVALYYHAEDGEVLVDEEAALARLKWFGTQEKGISLANVDQIAFETKLPPEAVRERLEALGYIVMEDEAEALQYDKHRLSKRKADRSKTAVGEVGTQYGVLQPAANLGAGLLSLWLWIILIVLVIAAVVSLLSMFN